MTDPGHIPVLPEQTIQGLAPAPGQTLLDCTLGRGGHAAMLMPLIAGGTYIGLDLDAENLAYATQRLQSLAREHDVTLHTLHRSFRDARAALAELAIDGVSGLLADLGFASNQVDDAARGLGFREDGPLDMRLNPDAPLTAANLLEQLGETELADVIWRYGEERLSRRIARKIVERREAGEPITGTSDLASLVRRAYGPAGRRSKIDPATRTFMALRIAVNDELGALDQLLEDLPSLIRPGGRAAIISFHSLEDRPVKQRFVQLSQDGIGQRITRKPLIADEAEQHRNPRSRSAKLRVFEKTTNSRESNPKTP